MRPGQRHLYRISSTLPRLGSPLKPPMCLTCTILSDMTSDDENGHRISSVNWQNGLINRNEWHETDNNKEHHQSKDKKDKSKNRNVSSECQHYFFILFEKFKTYNILLFSKGKKMCIIINKKTINIYYSLKYIF